MKKKARNPLISGNFVQCKRIGKYTFLRNFQAFQEIFTTVACIPGISILVFFCSLNIGVHELLLVGKVATDFWDFSSTDVVLIELLATLADNQITEGAENRMILESSALADSNSRGVAGEGLWALEAWVTDEPASNDKFAVQSQILSSSQSDMNLQPGGSLQFGQVAYTHDMSEVTCVQAKYLCVQLMKGPAPDG